MIFDRAQFVVQPVSRLILKRAASIRATTGFRIPDSIHLATAHELNADFIISADKRLKAPGGVELVRIDELVWKQA